MRYLLTLWFLLMLYTGWANAQQLTISVNRSIQLGYNYNSFDKRFLPDDNTRVNLSQTNFYKERRISKIELLNSYDKSVYWSTTLDTAGNILEEGQSGSHYFIATVRSNDSNRQTSTLVTAYYLGKKLMRVDTAVSVYHSYHNADTSIDFTRKVVTTYFNGTLLNEQNEYYNKAFLHKSISTQNIGGIAFSGKKKKHVYLRKRFKTNYDSTKLYLSKMDTRDVGLSISIDSGKQYLSMEQVNKHPFLKTYSAKSVTKCYTSGSCFIEPHLYYEAMPCGTAIYEMQKMNSNTTYGFTKDKDGLYETYYSTYRSLNLGSNENVDNNGREVLYLLRYSYFK